MNDKDDKFSSDFEDDFEDKKNAEQDEFVDHFDDDEPHFGEKASSKEKDEFDEFDEHHKHDEFSTEEPEEYESEVKEEVAGEDDSPRGKGAIDYLKNNAIFLVIGGFFIITGVIRLYTMFAGAPAQQQVPAQGQSQNLQFAQKNQQPAATPTKESNEAKVTQVTQTEQSKEANKPAAVATTGMTENTQTAPGAQAQPLPFAQTPTTAQPVNNNPAPAAIAAVPSIAGANPATVPSQANPGGPSVLATPPAATTSPTPVVAQTPTSPPIISETVETTLSAPTEISETESVEQTNAKNKQGSKISAFFANGKPVSEKEFKQINEKIATLEKKLKELTTLEDKLTRVQTPGGSSSDLTDLKNQLIQTNKIVTELSNQVRAQQLNNNLPMALGVNESTLELPPRGVLGRPQPVRDVIVQAVIPGRAWLRDLKGRLITVQVGDDIPGYGTVVSIDAHRGIVTTSEHFEFRAL